MPSNDTASAYARALFELAALSDSVDAADVSMAAVVAAIRGELDLREALTDTSVPVEAKRAVLREIFGAGVTPEALAIVTVLVERDLAGLLADVARIYGEIAEAERGIVAADVTTAVPLDDALRASLTDKLAASLGRPVSLREHVDASIVGGVVIKVAGRVLDGSVASQLDSVRRALSTDPGGEA
ncbi:MAG TPA: ATP synthase F1 subunit delta [Coriobacteriia bacterium]